MKTTVFLLIAEFEGQVNIPLKDVAPKYFGLTESEAKRRAALQQLPIPAFRNQKSQKSPWLISALDLAEWIDREREAAHSLHFTMNG